MSEPARIPLRPKNAVSATSRAHLNRLSALDALESGFTLFRSTFGSESWRYYLGSGPFVVASIAIWVMNGQIRISNAMLLLESLLLAGAYVWRLQWVSRYMQRVRERAFAVSTSHSAGFSGRIAALSRLLAWKFALSLGAVCGGASWLYSAGQFASIEVAANNAEKISLGGCIKFANQWFGSGLLLLVMLFPLWFAVWVNCLILSIFVPQLLHSVLGLNTLLSTAMGVYALIRSSAFWLATFAGAWLALDPIIKCSYVVVYQHLRSREEGDDLRGLLANLPRERQNKAQMAGLVSSTSSASINALLVLFVLLASSFLTSPVFAAQAPAQNAPTYSDPAHQAQIERLRHALDEESQRAIYRWHDAEHPNPPTWFEKKLRSVGRAIGRALDAIGKFFRRLWPSGLNLSPSSNGSSKWRMQDLRMWLFLILIFTLVAAAVLLWLRRRRNSIPISIPVQIAPLPDLIETALATARSETEWFELSSKLKNEGELRLAVRAAYLGLLAGLGQRQWLSIRRDRTNREYLDEFSRRWRRRPQASVDSRKEIPEKLRGSLRQFDGVWYGSQELSSESVAVYQQNQKDLLNNV